ncbi:9788_t:CDS:1, partial [Acaulospora morrowiae]
AYSPQHFYQNRILDQYVAKRANKITLRQLIVFGRNLSEERIIRSGNYVRTELAIRLAHRIRNFQNLPFIVGTNPHIAKVYDLYWTAFETFIKFPPIKTMADNDEFCKVLKTLLKDHLVVIPQLAMGIMECGEHLTAEQVNRFMNTMLRSRISRRVLAEQQIALTENWHDPGYGYGSDESGEYIGVVSTKCNAKEIVEKCAEMTNNLCKTIYNIESPAVIIDGGNDTVFSYIPDHIEYIIYELLKNSMRGVLEKHGSLLSQSPPPKDTQAQLPPILVTICSGLTDIYIRISDQGGGIPDRIYPHIWSFWHASNDKKISHKFTNFSKVPQMAGTVQENISPDLRLGIGLPMSKVYAEYLGGELTIFTMDGYGTDAYIKITKLGNKEENLV